MLNAMMHENGNEWSALEWRRRLETFGHDDNPAIASGPAGEVDSIWYQALHI